MPALVASSKSVHTLTVKRGQLLLVTSTNLFLCLLVYRALQVGLVHSADSACSLIMLNSQASAYYRTLKVDVYNQQVALHMQQLYWQCVQQQGQQQGQFQHPSNNLPSVHPYRTRGNLQLQGGVKRQSTMGAAARRMRQDNRLPHPPTGWSTLSEPTSPPHSSPTPPFTSSSAIAQREGGCLREQGTSGEQKSYTLGKEDEGGGEDGVECGVEGSVEDGVEGSAVDGVEGSVEDGVEGSGGGEGGGSEDADTVLQAFRSTCTFHPLVKQKRTLHLTCDEVRSARGGPLHEESELEEVPIKEINVEQHGMHPSPASTSDVQQLSPSEYAYGKNCHSPSTAMAATVSDGNRAGDRRSEGGREGGSPALEQEKQRAE